MNKIEVAEKIELFDHFVFLKKEKTLIMSDLHIGLEEVMHKEGFLIPKINFSELNKRVETALKKLKPKKIILNGDIKHEFGSINREEWKNISNFLDVIKKYANVIIIEGNHDKIFRPIALKKGIETCTYYLSEDKKIFVCHGDNIIKNNDFEKSKFIVIGHVHPAITLRDGFRNEKFKCFLYGTWNDKKIIFMPSLNFVNEGSDISRDKLIGPFIKKINIKKCELIVIADRLYSFGLVGKLK